MIFNKQLGQAKEAMTKIHACPDAKPCYCKQHVVPHALRGKVEQELDHLERHGIIEAIQFADWAAPIVPVVKQDGSVHICGDYKVTINRAVKLNTYPLLKIQDLLASLAGGKSLRN